MESREYPDAARPDKPKPNRSALGREKLLPVPWRVSPDPAATTESADTGRLRRSSNRDRHTRDDRRSANRAKAPPRGGGTGHRRPPNYHWLARWTKGDRATCPGPGGTRR